MTELEIMQRAKLYMEKLSQGIDPISNREVPEDSVLNNVRLARCFFYVSDVLGQVIANGGKIGSRGKRERFSITQEQLDALRPSREPVRISQLVERINEVTADPLKRKLNATVVTNWLLDKGFLVKQTGEDGRSRRIPTPSGFLLGLSIQTFQGQQGEYQTVLYNTEAQQFVLDHLTAILAEREAKERIQSPG